MVNAVRYWAKYAVFRVLNLMGVMLYQLPWRNMAIVLINTALEQIRGVYPKSDINTINWMRTRMVIMSQNDMSTLESERLGENANELPRKMFNIWGGSLDMEFDTDGDGRFMAILDAWHAAELDRRLVRASNRW